MDATHRVSIGLIVAAVMVGACSSSGGNGAAPLSMGTYEIVQAFPDLTFARPVDLQNAGDGTNRLFVVEQPGRILVFVNSDTTNTTDVFLDVQSQVDNSGDEEGLLGLAFHPDFANNGHYFVYYTIGGSSRVSRFTVDAQNPNATDMASQVDVITIAQPYENHNGGQIAFGPDGMLYIALGDGGSANDPQDNGQNRATLLGSILRIAVDTLPYSIPNDNPLAGNLLGYREEIWAYGLRNPWRFSFDPVTGWLWCADVGQGRYEEIDIIEGGKNYGWKIMEGAHCRPPTTGCATGGLELPIWEYEHGGGRVSVTGGYVYRGSRFTELVGAYFYADYLSGEIWMLSYDGTGTPVNELVQDATFRISSFGVDEAGELYICGLLDGKIHTLAETTP